MHIGWRLNSVARPSSNMKLKLVYQNYSHKLAAINSLNTFEQTLTLLRSYQGVDCQKIQNGEVLTNCTKNARKTKNGNPLAYYTQNKGYVHNSDTNECIKPLDFIANISI